MMKTIDDISHYVKYLFYQYIITAFRLHSADVVTRLFVYSFDVFICCNNPHHITASDTLSISITTSWIPSILTLYYIKITFSTVFIFDFVLIISHQDPEYHILTFPVTVPLEITWILFDLMINYLALFYFVKGTIPYNILSENPIVFHFSIYLTIFHHTFSSL